jgi:transaldolase
MNAIQRLRERGVSVWLDDLSRERLETGNLASYVAEGVSGVTTNPTIFAGALSGGSAYDEQVRELASSGADLDETVTQLTTDDVRAACDVLLPVNQATGGVDGRVSIEVDPRLAFDTEGTLQAALRLWKIVDRPNLLIKIPATPPSLPAVRAALGSGVSVNVTLIFGLGQYQAVIDAYLDGLEDALAAGHDLSTIHSVASFFVSRVDSLVDKKLESNGSDSALALRGKAGVANAQLAYRAYEKRFSDARFVALAEQGALHQRPLWASTSVKNPDYSPTLYVDNLVAPGTVNTMPEKTLHAVEEHGDAGIDLRDHYDEADAVMRGLADHDISYDSVIEELEQEGVDKFIASWTDLLNTVNQKLEAAR